MIPVHGQENPVPAENKKLYDQIARLDSVMFSIIYTCQPEKVSKYFTDDMEFYHDKGENNYSKESFLATLNKNFCGSNKSFHVMQAMAHSLLKSVNSIRVYTNAPGH